MKAWFLRRVRVLVPILMWFGDGRTSLPVQQTRLSGKHYISGYQFYRHTHLTCRSYREESGRKTHQYLYACDFSNLSPV